VDNTGSFSLLLLTNLSEEVMITLQLRLPQIFISQNCIDIASHIFLDNDGLVVFIKSDGFWEHRYSPILSIVAFNHIGCIDSSLQFGLKLHLCKHRPEECLYFHSCYILFFDAPCNLQLAKQGLF